MNNWKLSIASILMICLVTRFGTCEEKWGVPEDSDVAVLTDDNFENFVNKHEWVFVKFYAPWCGHCKSMAPSYAELALTNKYAEGGIPIAKVDCTIHTKVAAKYGVGGYPTLKLFNHGGPIDFKGGREKDEIEGFIKRKKEAQLQMIDSIDELEELKGAQLAVIYYLESKKAEDLANFRKFFLNFDQIPIVYTHNKKIQEAMGGKEASSLIVIRDFDDGNRVINKNQAFKDSELSEEFKKVRFGMVMEYSDEVAEKLQDEKKPVVYLFTADKHGENMGLLRKVAEKYVPDYSFVHVDVHNEKVKRLAEFLGVNTNENIRLMVQKGQKPFKYKINEISEKNLVQLIDDHKAGKARQYLKTDSIPLTNDQPVKVIVGANFNERILKSNTHVLLEVYAPWCGHCKRLEPIYNELAVQLSHYDDLVIAKMDGASNEYPNLETKGYPTILFYPKGKKDKPIKYESDHDIQKFVVFLNRHIGRVHKLQVATDL